MPAFLEKKLRAEYGDNPHAIYGTMNAIGAMHGNKETAKGRAMEAKHKADEKSHRVKLHGHAVRHGHGGGRAEAYVDGAMAERGGQHKQTGEHTNALKHAASGHGWNGAHAEAYAHGAENERAGVHGAKDADGD
jgi:hypothetical protein